MSTTQFNLDFADAVGPRSEWSVIEDDDESFISATGSSVCSGSTVEVNQAQAPNNVDSGHGTNTAHSVHSSEHDKEQPSDVDKTSGLVSADDIPATENCNVRNHGLVVLRISSAKLAFMEQQFKRSDVQSKQIQNQSVELDNLRNLAEEQKAHISSLEKKSASWKKDVQSLSTTTAQQTLLANQLRRSIDEKDAEIRILSHTATGSSKQVAVLEGKIARLLAKPGQEIGEEPFSFSAEWAKQNIAQLEQRVSDDRKALDERKAAYNKECGLTCDLQKRKLFLECRYWVDGKKLRATKHALALAEDHCSASDARVMLLAFVVVGLLTTLVLSWVVLAGW
ncbi:hypothetical protein K402DRAFT_31261 [Aulographum hederae CBS 113979]|uniref:Uncharacterized protein n=1 Tax=Aulographum hederae CBS 113979 TaxID=1176131 RepID=A0A6G1H4S5_9PEZI|nr:hypothetical protein K402DRAFT_31261 [Aulographum hederae CBS 113979]